MVALTGSVDEDSSLRDSDVELLTSDDEDQSADVVLDDSAAVETCVVSLGSERSHASSVEHLQASSEEAKASKPSRASKPSEASEPSEDSEPSRASEPSAPSKGKLRRSGPPQKAHEFHGAVFDVDALDATTCQKCGRKETDCRCILVKQLQQKISTLRNYQEARARTQGFKSSTYATHAFHGSCTKYTLHVCVCVCVSVSNSFAVVF